ncbi:hypothetical protein ABT381_05030 [Streptomyces sp. NPDC000151]|uniref:hypothetical protein n=1 Tax=Streptomyces sp. NPDC000151 TaxID=3154244 RepID=UPI0033166433
MTLTRYTTSFPSPEVTHLTKLQRQKHQPNPSGKDGAAAARTAARSAQKYSDAEQDSYRCRHPNEYALANRIDNTIDAMPRACIAAPDIETRAARGRAEAHQDLPRALGDAECTERAALYRRLGLTFTYDSTSKKCWCPWTTSECECPRTDTLHTHTPALRDELRLP